MTEAVATPPVETKDDVAAVLAVAMQLPLNDRAKIAQQLLATLDGEGGDSEEVAAAWREESQRRYQQIKDGTAVLFDADEVMREARRLVTP